MEKRQIKCTSCKTANIISSDFIGDATFQCKHCNLTNQINSRSGLIRYKVAKLLSIIVLIIMIFSDKSGWGDNGQSAGEFLIVTIIAMVIICTIVFFGTLLIAKIMDWLDF
jgi:hypothetical protein